MHAQQRGQQRGQERGGGVSGGGGGGVLRAVDLGCGKGRDAVWLASL